MMKPSVAKEEAIKKRLTWNDKRDNHPHNANISTTVTSPENYVRTWKNP
jgi:hypothetical protein